MGCLFGCATKFRRGPLMPGLVVVDKRPERIALPEVGCFSTIPPDRIDQVRPGDRKKRSAASSGGFRSTIVGVEADQPSHPFREERTEHVVATLEQLAALVRGRLVGDGQVAIQAARPVTEAGPGDITFVDDERYARLLRDSPASAAIVGPHFRVEPQEKRIARIEVDDPRSAFIAVRQHLSGELTDRWTGVHEKAYVAPTAKLAEGVAVYPFALRRRKLRDRRELHASIPAPSSATTASSARTSSSTPTSSSTKA